MVNFRHFAVWIIIGLLLFALYNLFQGQSQRVGAADISYSDFIGKVETGEVKSVTIAGDVINGQYNDGRSFQTYTPQDPNLITQLRDKGIDIKARPATDESFLTSMLVSWFPIILMIGVWVFFMRQMQSGGNRALSFGRSRAKLLSAQGKKVTFRDVAGIEEAKDELQEIIEFLREPQKF
ncbi:MAG TPA: ATP-dependent metallopeptidase FtsH/Yme1/Tma family protein, partial [Aestuariivirgaceae bacterium]